MNIVLTAVAAGVLGAFSADAGWALAGGGPAPDLVGLTGAGFVTFATVLASLEAERA